MTRSVLVDSFKAVASQLIVLHHLFLYSPMADWLAQAWPEWVALIVEDGRLAVQVFLVIGGFLAAQTLHKGRDHRVSAVVLQRYLRLVPPLGFALLLVVAVTVMVGQDLAREEWVSPLPSVPVLLAHLLLLQDILGVPSLLAGAWYVAIDLQLFALFAVLMFAARKLPRSAMNLVVPAMLAASTWASIFVFSRQPGLDMWAIYFMSAYGLGALAAWAAFSPIAKWLWWMTAALVAADFLLEPRERPLWAWAAALALYAGSQKSWGVRSGLPAQIVQSLSTWSYGVFICHFAVIILVSGLWLRFGFSGANAALLAVLLVTVVSIGLGAWVQTICDKLVNAGNRRWLALTSPR